MTDAYVHSQRTRNTHARANVRSHITRAQKQAHSHTASRCDEVEVTCDEVMGGARCDDVLKGVVR